MNKNAFIGLDLGGTFLKYALGLKDGTVLYKSKRPSQAKEGQRAVFDTMFAAVEELLQEAVRLGVSVKAIGCGSPGAVDFDHGKILGNAPNIAEWHNADIRGQLSGRFNLPVWADNDANLMTLAECRYGVAADFRYIIALTLGTGIGGGIVIDNELYRGAKFCGAELGHMSIKYDGILCKCGSIGCIEAYASAPAMVRNYIEKLNKNKLAVPSAVDTVLIFSQARQGQTEAIAVIDEVCHYLGVAIGNIINIFNPEIIVIGGGVADAGDDFIAQIWKQSESYSMQAARHNVKLVRARLGNDAGVIGAFALAADNYEKHENKFPNALSIAEKPTPLQLLSRWSGHLRGPNIWCKRDDLTGVLLSGNKVRKLEFVVQDALEHKARMLITCGGIQSNHARTTAALAARLGLGCHLLLKGTAPENRTGNFLLDHLLDARIEYITAEEYAQHSLDLMREVAARYAKEGILAYVIPEGASCALGTFGYARVIEELAIQSTQQGVKIDAIVCATGSGGTQAGLILGTRIFDWPVPVFGINICDDAGYFRQKILHLLAEVQQTYLPQLPMGEEDIRIIDGYTGEGYGKATTAELSTLTDLARIEGIVLEPVYTGKAMHGLRQEIAAGRMERLKNIIFIHTGGIFGLFPFSGQFSPLVH